MKVQVEVSPVSESSADLVVAGIFAGEDPPEQLIGAPGAADARGKFHSTALVHPVGTGPARVLLVGLGKPGDLDAERLRVAAAVAATEAARMELSSIAWLLPEPSDELSPDDAAAALVSGTTLAGYRFDRFKSDTGEEQPARVESLSLLLAETSDEARREQVAAAAEAELIASLAQNRARDLQGTPGNHLTPAILAERAAEIADRFRSVRDETLGPEQIQALGMGGMIAVSQGSAEQPRLIVLRYDGGGEQSPTLGLVGKSVTFDTGGISLKPPASMPDMKMDMSGGAAVMEAVAAIAELELPLNLVAVMPAVENMPSGTAIKPGDIITQYSGKTVEVNNTDAEGRLVLADALTFCNELGVDRMVDLATLTGAAVVALGSTYSALISNHDEFAAQVEHAGAAAGELAWRLPLHDEYRELTRGKVADLTNASAKRKAGTIYAGAFLEEFVGDTPWAHLDIAGTAWDTGRLYVGDGPSGVGVRLLVNLARRLSQP